MSFYSAVVLIRNNNVRTKDGNSTINVDMMGVSDYTVMDEVSGETVFKVVSSIGTDTDPVSPIIESCEHEGDHISIVWNAVAGNNIKYNVYRCSTPNGEFRLINSVPVDGCSYDDFSGVDPGASYLYAVTAIDEDSVNKSESRMSDISVAVPSDVMEGVLNRDVWHISNNNYTVSSIVGYPDYPELPDELGWYSSLYMDNDDSGIANPTSGDTNYGERIYGYIEWNGSSNEIVCDLYLSSPCGSELWMALDHEDSCNPAKKEKVAWVNKSVFKGSFDDEDPNNGFFKNIYDGSHAEWNQISSTNTTALSRSPGALQS